ncbi:helix-turn-helix transcriptional regulator [Marivita sp. S2033]|uniref:helix-turn-helix transcriptional regulator n=1 Tax=Marivita sp. S2033 TaxID=3373187 RepID=UPI00398283B5
MARLWVWGTALVTLVAALKTFLVVHIALANTLDWAMISAIFASFFGLTAIVAYVSFIQLRKHMDRQRKQKVTPHAGEQIAKETVIVQNANLWGLSKAEADVAIFVVKGFSNAEIAEMRNCAIATVKSQLGKIYHKSGLKSRYQLIAFVTDEVCTMATEEPTAPTRKDTQNILPLAGRSQSAA